jgi:hypothetical protein
MASLDSHGAAPASSHVILSTKLSPGDLPKDAWFKQTLAARTCFDMTDAACLPMTVERNDQPRLTWSEAVLTPGALKSKRDYSS